MRVCVCVCVCARVCVCVCVQVYASYGARYEGRIVQQLIRNDGGKGDYTETTPPMLGIWDTLMQV